METMCVWFGAGGYSLAWQALGAQPCRVNIVQCCAGFGGMAGKAEIVQGWGARSSELELLQDCAGLGRHGLPEIVNVRGSLALRAHPVEILQV
jgi:hypothetical protein